MSFEAMEEEELRSLLIDIGHYVSLYLNILFIAIQI
jgi:hypothetical protein